MTHLYVTPIVLRDPVIPWCLSVNFLLTMHPDFSFPNLLREPWTFQLLFIPYQALCSNLNRDSAFQQSGWHLHPVTDAHGDCSLPIAICGTNRCWLVLSGKEPALDFSLRVHVTILAEILILTFPFGGSLGTLFFIKIQITHQSYLKRITGLKEPVLGSLVLSQICIIWGLC